MDHCTASAFNPTATGDSHFPRLNEELATMTRRMEASDL